MQAPTETTVPGIRFEKIDVKIEGNWIRPRVWVGDQVRVEDPSFIIAIPPSVTPQEFYERVRANGDICLIEVDSNYNGVNDPPRFLARVRVGLTDHEKELIKSFEQSLRDRAAVYTQA